MCTNISKITEKQKKITLLDTEISNYNQETQKIPVLNDVIVEAYSGEAFYGADEIANLMLDFINSNNEILDNENKIKLQDSVKLLKDINQKEKNSLNLHDKAIKKNEKEILKLHNEILELIKDDFNFEEDYISIFKVNTRLIKEYKDVFAKYLEDNNVAYLYTDSNKICFISKNKEEKDLRELIQDEIRKISPNFNFKSLATKEKYHLTSKEVIKLLYS